MRTNRKISNQPAIPAYGFGEFDAAEVEKLRESLLEAKSDFSNAVSSGDKSVIREAHLVAKSSADSNQHAHLLKLLQKRQSYFVKAQDIDVSRIRPTLVEVVDQRSLEAELFRLGRATWSLPYSKGYGRRLRFLVIDEHHQALMGVIGLQSPPADLACRDALVGKCDDKLRWVNGTMDAFTVGAVEPYRMLLGGKLVAGMLACADIQQAYWRKYGTAKTQMEKRMLQQPLLGITTVSAFGRSSIYNRLKWGSDLLAEPIGYTKGYGAIHLEHHYKDIEAFLSASGNLTQGGFGHGPKVRWQNIQNAAKHLNLPGDLLKHGLEREVFLFRHVENFEAAAALEEMPVSKAYRAEEWAEYWLNRYCIPRAARKPEYANFCGLESAKSSIEGLRKAS